MKKILAALLCLTMLLGTLAACGTSGSNNSGTPDSNPGTSAPAEDNKEPANDGQPLKVAVLTGSLTNTPFCVAMADAIYGKMEAEGWELNVFDADMDATKQSTQFETALMMEPDVIVYWCRDSLAAVEDVKKAAAAGIPVIALNNDIDQSGWEYVECFVGPDQYQIGYDLALYMMETKETANIAIVDGLANNSTYLFRYNGFMAAIEGNENYNVLVHDYCNVDRTTAQTMTENYITGFDNLDTVVVFSDNFALGSINAIQAANKSDDIDVFSIDGMQIGFDAVKEGSLAATVLQTPGFQIEKVIDIIKNYIVPGVAIEDHNQFSGHYVIHAENVDDYQAEY